MIVDCHVHISAHDPALGHTSRRLDRSVAVRLLRWRLGIDGSGAEAQHLVEQRLFATLDAATHLDRAVVLAFDAVHDWAGRLDRRDTHFHVSNEYVMRLARRHPKVLFGASIHPYRRDALAELERCVRNGAVLIKWLPITQRIDPTDRRCLAFYEALAHYGVPLLSHTGSERILPTLDRNVADPALLVPALRAGATVIAAHCGTRSLPGERSFVETFARLAREYERFFGDTSGLNLPGRWYAYDTILEDSELRAKLVHGSDWPIPALPDPRRLGWASCRALMAERSAMHRDVLIKRRLGLDEAYWHRAASLLRLPSVAARSDGPGAIGPPECTSAPPGQ